MTVNEVVGRNGVFSSKLGFFGNSESLLEKYTCRVRSKERKATAIEIRCAPASKSPGGIERTDSECDGDPEVV